jgi:AcrR family transcriptional regulator
MPQSGSSHASVDARILAVATEHLRRFGASRTTVTGIAQEAGMTHANVYRYFPSKTALADAVTAAWLKPLELLLADVADAPDPADDKLERMLTALAGAQRDRLEADPYLFDVFADAMQEGRGVARKHRARVRTLLDRVVEEGIGSAVFTVRRRDRAVTLILDLVHRFVTPASVLADREVPRRTLEERLSLTLAAVRRALKSGIA